MRHISAPSLDGASITARLRFVQRTPCRNVATTAALAFVALLLYLVPADADARTRLVELRVEGPSDTLEAGTWYVTGKERIRKSKPSDACNRAKGRIAVPGPTPLSLAQTGADFNRDLRQVRVRRDEAGLFTCEIGSILGRPFSDPAGFAGWSYYESFVFGSAAADQLRLKDNDRVLWVFSDFGAGTPANTGPALELRRVPARTEGTFIARVVEHAFDGSTNPATGATIAGAESVSELGGGRYEVTVDNGSSTLRATRGLDIASNQVETCSKAKLSRCPKAHGRAIVGSDRADDLKGTRGWDDISSGPGRDVISLRRGGHDRAKCGGGTDVVLVKRGDRDDRIARDCERKRRK
jgi:hypothetical protein